MTLHRDEIPDWLRFDHINTGYRYIKNATYKTYLPTLFTLHNETINIWTMLYTNIISLLLFLYSFLFLPFNILHFSAFCAMYVTSLLHLPFSVAYHLFSPISPGVYNRLRKLDITFIFISSIFLTYALSCRVFSAQVTILLCLLCVICTYFAYKTIRKLQDKQRLDKKKQTFFIATIVFIYTFPMIYQSLANHGVYTQLSTICVILSLLFGGYVYAFNIPEKYYPNKFDVFGSSHNIMHICIMIAHIFEYVFLFTL